jgi:hypothetical protein
MTTCEEVDVCGSIISKLSSGQSLDAAEKAHLTDCADCVREIVFHLVKRAGTEIIKGTPGSSRVPDEVRHAIATGRQLLEREFGIPV